MKFIEINAKIHSKTFYCRSLAGNSKYYNLSIASDMNVSCNCSDIYGEGILGNLKHNSLNEIMHGKKADSFRKKLANGKLPITNCVTCDDLTTKAINYRYPKNLLIENTIHCNLNCLGCYREDIQLLRKKKSLSLHDIEKIAKSIKGIKTIYYYNQGEPFFSKNIKKELQIIKKYNPDIKIIISTNGLLLNTKEKREAAMLADEIIFSIHGSNNRSLRRYQKNGDFNKVYTNMKKLIDFRGKKDKPVITWKYVLFWWNDSSPEIKNAINLAKEINLNGILFEKTQYPLYAVSFKHHLSLGYLNKISNFEKNICYITS